MNDVVQLHPEDLLDKHHGGGLSDDERRRLDAHLEGCATCRLEIALGDDLAAEEEEQPADLTHLVLGAVPAPRRARLPGARWLWVLAAVVVAGSAGAAYLGARAGSAPGTEEPPSVPMAPATTAEPRPAAAASEPAASDVVDDVDEASPAPSVSPSTASGETAASLFAAGNAARRAGQRQEALRRYARLQARFPESREARTSRAIVADLVAEDDPGAAVSAYDEYLDEGGRLGEEALVGRAEALRQAGRHDEEAASWRELLARHPHSIHAARARARLAAIAAGTAGTP